MAPPADPTSGLPTFSLIVPTYDVAPYLTEFLASLDAQTYLADDPTDVEVVVIDDGSTDGSADILRVWATRTRLNVSIHRQDNAGLSAARNAGLRLARGTWVSFPDPDDRLAEDYLAVIAAFLAGTDPAPDLICTRALVLDDRTGEVADTHPLRRKFADGTRIVDLDHQPEIVHLQAASACYRRDRIADLGLAFDPAIRPTFEDGSFTARYLSAHAHPRLALLADAHYLYRRRDDGSSLVQRSWGQPAKYADVLEHGYLALLRDTRDQLGLIPLWVQNTVLYDLLFTFRREDRPPGLSGLVDPAWTDRFHDLVGQILDLIDPETVAGFGVIPTSSQLRTALRVGYQGQDARPGELCLLRSPYEPELVQLRYWFGGEPPVETVQLDGAPVEPRYAKIRDVPYLGRVLVRERIAWLPADGDLRIRLDGHAMALQDGPPVEPTYTLAMGAPHAPSTATPSSDPPPSGLPSWTPRRAVRPLLRGARRVVRALRQAQALRSSDDRSGPGRAGHTSFPEPVEGQSSRHPNRGARGWPFDRRRERTPDSSPLGTKIRPQEPKVGAQHTGDGAPTAGKQQPRRQAWLFTGDPAGPGDTLTLFDWIREHHPDVDAWWLGPRRGSSARTVEPGSVRHRTLLRAAGLLIADDPDRAQWRPGTGKRHRTVAQPLAYLPTHPISAPASRWLSRTPVELIFAADQADRQQLVADHTPSPLTDHEVRVTGYPRHDRLHRLAAEVVVPDLALIDLAPIDLVPTDLAPTDLALIDGTNGPAGLEHACRARGLTVHRLDRRADAQLWLARSALVITDRAWVAYDASALGRSLIAWDPAADPATLPYLVRTCDLAPATVVEPDEGACARVYESLRAFTDRLADRPTD